MFDTISMKTVSITILILFIFQASYAGKISGHIRDVKGEPLSYSSIIVKGTSKGVVANSEGIFTITLEVGTYTLICQHVGYQSQEKIITITGQDVVVDFLL